MFVDASAMVAILVEEEDAASLTQRLAEAREVFTSPIAIYEAVLGVVRIKNISVSAAQSILDRFLAQVSAHIVSVTTETGRGAVAAFGRYGRQRHAAALNMGDCFAYACARRLDVPLLYKGDGFSRTDIA